MSIICESSICTVTLNYLTLPTAQLPPSVSWWTVQIDGLETSVMKDAMRSEYPELEKGTHQNRLFFQSPETMTNFETMGVFSKTTQYLNSVSNLGYRISSSTAVQEINSGVMQYQYCFQR